YEKIFSKGVIVNLDSLAGDRAQLIYQKKLVYSVLDVLTEERDDIVTKGELSARDIYIMLKMNQNLRDRKSTRLNSSHVSISYAVFCLKIKKVTMLSR